jgi:hypothetical protein
VSYRILIRRIILHYDTNAPELSCAGVAIATGASAYYIFDPSFTCLCFSFRFVTNMRMRLYICTVLAICHIGRAEVIYNSRNPLILAATNQCSSSDRQLWQNSTQSSQKFFQTIQSCTTEGAGATDLSQNVTSCMQDSNPGLSQNCARRVPCQNGQNSSECTTCLNPCTQRLVSCTGTNTLPAPNGTTNASSFAFGIEGIGLITLVLSLSHLVFLS